MDDHIDPSVFGLDDRFAVGQPVPRSEDPVLLRGEGRYSDDVSLPGQAYAVMVRSRNGHGVIRVQREYRAGGKVSIRISNGGDIGCAIVGSFGIRSSLGRTQQCHGPQSRDEAEENGKT